MLKSLANQVALITGGNAGIGKAIAHKFASEGATVVLFGTNPETGLAAVTEIQEAHPEVKVKFIPVDVSKTSLVDHAVEEVLKEFGQIDILVNNAGITADQLLIRMTEEEWDRVLEINLKSCFNMCRAVARLMIKKRKGNIINISSVVGLVGNAGQMNYAASKAGMIGMTKALAKELAGRNVRVNCVAPGFVKTKMTDALNEKQQQDVLQAIPLKRMGAPEEIANPVWFLASDLSSYMTGQVIAVDGGMTMC